MQCRVGYAQDAVASTTRACGYPGLRRLRGYATVSTKATVADGRLRVSDRELRVTGTSTGTVKVEYGYPNQETGYAYAYAYAYGLRSMECELHKNTPATTPQSGLPGFLHYPLTICARKDPHINTLGINILYYVLTHYVYHIKLLRD